ncbi:hypothetical protein C8R47DRAFT_242587 [Mycena vitilis]|nr:hypothetical protein C8R47DRAFT_1329216 [Mycena vitilis]KAJ6453876.1 hypothetical protein C8R47DRAFT_242587 [Mycena vitilis]
MASRATDNLRTYFRRAALPQMLRDPKAPDMPLSGQRSHHVTVQTAAQPWRQLTEVRGVEESWGLSLDEMATCWVDEKIPTESLGAEDFDSDTGERFTVPCVPTFDIPDHSARRPTDIMRLIPWLDNLPLLTVQRTLHILFPKQTASWNFSLVDGDENRDRKVYQHFLWSYSGAGRPTIFTPLGNISRYPLVVAFQPPWILSEQDMIEFSECRTFPRFSTTNGRLAGLEARERLWAKVWDTCVTNKTRWFVLTSYNHWVFGAFSEGWTMGFVSEVYPFNTCGPTILELLAFWVACAMRLPGWRDLPKVREPITAGPPRVPAPAARSGNTEIS